LGWVILDVHVVGLLCLVGFIGNALTIAVLRRDWQDGSNATNWQPRNQDGHCAANWTQDGSNATNWQPRNQDGSCATNWTQDGSNATNWQPRNQDGSCAANWTQDGSNATNWLLRTLAGVDTFYLIACLFVQTFNTTHDLTDWFPGALRPYFPYAERYMWPVASIAQTVAIWTVLLVTVDRYMAVCRRAGKVTVGLAAMRHFVTAGSWPSVGM